MKKITVFVPDEHVEFVKNAMFEAGAGAYKHYTRCCWQSRGAGQFMPLESAHPRVGAIREVSFVDETRLEMLCEDLYVEAVIKTLISAHPYESPAYDVVALERWGA